MKSAKEYFTHDFLADDDTRQINLDLVDFISSMHPKSCFEFGCGQAKNLVLLRRRHHIRNLAGIDISKRAIELGQKWKAKVDSVVNFALAVGDESFLQNMRSHSYDVCFTCSVLDHIPRDRTVERILTELKRIAIKAVVLCETLADRPSIYYYPHIYEGFGFHRSKYEYYSDPYKTGGDGATYFMYSWRRTEIDEEC